ncbi:MAG TPA: hypothetical protein VFX59_16060 [Polyangiales bacterium]|nr:hypothetical protein [Polyangiales bacterium]
MLHETLFERVLSWLVSTRGEAHLHAARTEFEGATGAIVEGQIDYESRIAHFLEQHLCTGAPSPVAAFADAHPALAEVERRELAGWLRSHRSLFVYEGPEQGVRDLVLGGRYRVWLSEPERRLTPGDIFDGRLLPLADMALLGPGKVFHPREAHQALAALLAQVDFDSLPHAELLNGLLAMRTRFLTFESVRAEHVYQARALAPVHLPLRADVAR